MSDFSTQKIVSRRWHSFCIFNIFFITYPKKEKKKVSGKWRQEKKAEEGEQYKLELEPFHEIWFVLTTLRISTEAQF